VKKIVLALLVVALAVVAVSSIASAGNGIPYSGKHYNLNIIGVKPKTNADMKGNMGHRIFVNIQGKSKIMLCPSGEGTVCLDVPSDSFQVLDANGTDGEALFALPRPVADPDTGCAQYTVWARALGKPGKSAKMTTCFDDGTGYWCPYMEGTGGEVFTLDLNRGHGKQEFQDVSKYLLYYYYCTAWDGGVCTDWDREFLFTRSNEGYLWEYDNSGLKLAQLRFYPVSAEECGFPK